MKRFLVKFALQLHKLVSIINNEEKVFGGIVILLVGFLLGGISYYLMGKIVYPQSVRAPFAPRVPSQILETSRAFSEIVSAVSLRW